MSNLVLYKRPLNSAFSLLDREFGDLFDGFWNRSYAPAFNPRVEINETDKAYELTVEVPGVRKEEIHVETEDGTLRLWGEKKTENKSEQENCCFSERSYGSFERRFKLPDHVDAGKIEAHYRDGLLELRIPKAEQAQKKAIEIKVK